MISSYLKQIHFIHWGILWGLFISYQGGKQLYGDIKLSSFLEICWGSFVKDCILKNWCFSLKNWLKSYVID